MAAGHIRRAPPAPAPAETDDVDAHPARGRSVAQELGQLRQPNDAHPEV
jgi:hypothetical protein